MKIIIFVLFSLVFFVPVTTYAATCNENRHFVAETGFYDYNQHFHGVAGNILPAHYTGPSIALGFRPFCFVTFEIGYFRNGDTTRVSFGSKYQVYAQSTLRFSVVMMRAVINLFPVPFTHNTVTVNGIMSVNQLRYNGFVRVGYKGPKKSGNIKIVSMSGKESGPAIGVGLTYHPSNSSFEIGIRRTQYTYGSSDASLNVIFMRYRF